MVGEVDVRGEIEHKWNGVDTTRNTKNRYSCRVMAMEQHESTSDADTEELET